MADPDQQLTPEAKALLEQALKDYASTVFWNMRPTLTRDGLLSAAKALRKRGNLAAALLAKKMIHAA